MPWGEGVVARGWVYGMPRGWGGDTFTISCDSLSDREERRDPALRGSRNDERARRRFANRKTATRYIGEFTYSLSRSFLAPYIYIYIHLVLLSSACGCATTVLEEEILSLSRFWKLRKKREPSYLFFIRSFLRLLTFSSRLIFSILERVFLFFCLSSFHERKFLVKYLWIKHYYYNYHNYTRIKRNEEIIFRSIFEEIRYGSSFCITNMTNMRRWINKNRNKTREK